MEGWVISCFDRDLWDDGTYPDHGGKVVSGSDSWYLLLHLFGMAS